MGFDSRVEVLSSECSLHDVAVNNLNENQGPVVGHDVEGLGFDIGVRECAPAQNLLVHIREGSCLGLLRNRLKSLRAIDRLLGAHHGGETARMEIGQWNHNREGHGTYVDFNQFMVFDKVEINKIKLEKKGKKRGKREVKGRSTRGAQESSSSDDNGDYPDEREIHQIIDSGYCELSRISRISRI